MESIQNNMLPQHLQMNETERKLLAEEEKKYGTKLMEMPKDQKYGMCFACGEENPVGLHLHFFWIPNGVMAFFTPKPEHQSYNGRMHGGLITVQRRDGFLYSEAGTSELQWTDARRADHRTAG